MFYRVDSDENCSNYHKQTGVENIHSRVEVETIPTARVGNPTA